MNKISWGLKETSCSTAGGPNPVFKWKTSLGNGIIFGLSGAKDEVVSFLNLKGRSLNSLIFSIEHLTRSQLQRIDIIVFTNGTLLFSRGIHHPWSNYHYWYYRVGNFVGWLGQMLRVTAVSILARNPNSNIRGNFDHEECQEVHLLPQRRYYRNTFLWDTSDNHKICSLPRKQLWKKISSSNHLTLNLLIWDWKLVCQEYLQLHGLEHLIIGNPSIPSKQAWEGTITFSWRWLLEWNQLLVTKARNNL